MMKIFKQFLLATFMVACFSVSCYAATKWQYQLKTFPLIGDDKALTAKLNELGALQWELVNCTANETELTCIFKKPVE